MFCSVLWLWGCPVCILLLKRRQKCRDRCTGALGRFSSAIVCHPKYLPCLGGHRPSLAELSAYSAPKPRDALKLELVAAALRKVSCWQGHQEHLRRLEDFLCPFCSLKQLSLTASAGLGPQHWQKAWVREQHGSGLLQGETGIWGCGRRATGDSVAS